MKLRQDRRLEPFVSPQPELHGAAPLELFGAAPFQETSGNNSSHAACMSSFFSSFDAIALKSSSVISYFRSPGKSVASNSEEKFFGNLCGKSLSRISALLFAMRGYLLDRTISAAFSSKSIRALQDRVTRSPTSDATIEATPKTTVVLGADGLGNGVADAAVGTGCAGVVWGGLAAAGPVRGGQRPQQQQQEPKPETTCA